MWELDLDKEEQKNVKALDVKDEEGFDDFDDGFYDDFVIVER